MQAPGETYTATTDHDGEETMNKTLCIYHSHCLDGFGAAWVVRKALGNSVEFQPAAYGSAPPDVTGRDAVIVDFSYPHAVLMDMAQTARTVLVLDHHKSAAENLSAIPPVQADDWQDWINRAPARTRPYNAGVWFDMDLSGARMAWDFFFPKQEVPWFVRYIEDRDLWRFHHDNTKAVASYPMDFETWDELAKSADEIPQGNVELLVEGEAILRYQDKAIRDLIATAKTYITLDGHDVPALNCPPQLASEAGHILAEGEPFAVCWWEGPDGQHFSLRSAPDGLDVSEIARGYGGGGHKHAAGFVVPRRFDAASE
jgi:oligoribonuclease NrnB/cAMP/cGMP phosphodiesterase (DHH superfamily)